MTRTLVRLAAAGALVALAVLAGGWLLARTRLGADDADARARMQADVREAFGGMMRDLREVSASAVDPAAIRASRGEGDPSRAAVSRLFDSVEGAVDGWAPLDLALTIHGPDGAPLAWAGRPSELEPGRLAAGPERWFLEPGELGLRLIYVADVTDAGTRIGTVVAERPLDMLASARTGAAGQSPCGARETFCFPTRLGPVGIELPDGAPPSAGDVNRFQVATLGEVPLFVATIHAEDLVATRARWSRATRSLALMALAVTLLLLIAPFLDARNRARDVRSYLTATGVVALLVVGSRVVMSAASPADWSDMRFVSAVTYTSWLVPRLFTSPFDFLLTWLMVAALVGLLLFSVEQWRLVAAHRRRRIDAEGQLPPYLVTQVLAGAGVAVLLLGHSAFLQNTISVTTLDLVHFSLQPWDPSRTALQVGLIVAHATVAGLCVLLLRAALIPWQPPRHDWRVMTLTVICWVAPLTFAWFVLQWRPAPTPPLALAAVVVMAALAASQLKARYRHGSQAFRLMLLTLALIVPAVASYSTLFQLAARAKEELVATQYADAVLSQRDRMLTQLQRSMEQIDEMTDVLPRLRRLQRGSTPGEPDGSPAAMTAGPVSTDLAFSIWSRTDLQRYAITSSVELYGSDRRLVSRFAFNLPEDLGTGQPVACGEGAGRRQCSDETSCEWGPLAGEAVPFFAEDRRVLYAGRAICGPGGTHEGSIVVHAMLDYENLPFISSRTPYRELLRPGDAVRADDLPGLAVDLSYENSRGRDVEFAFYGWSGRQVYPTGAPAWQIDDALVESLAPTAAAGGDLAGDQFAPPPSWHQRHKGDVLYDVYLRSDRSGIYALGFPAVTSLGHLVNLAELTVLAAGTYVCLLLVNAVFGRVSQRRPMAPALLREIRASFYRKLFLAFVAAVILPVSALALLTRNYVADEMRASGDREAVRTASAARRMVEDLVSQLNLALDDNLMVFVSRVIDQDANIFEGPELIATSERDLFASDLLPTRIPADVYRALQLRNEWATVTEERVGALDGYLVAAIQLTERGRVLTVPLTSRQQEIENQITTLNRRLLLGALLFVLAGAFLGYWMAERISDPVNRLTRATRRIARGDLDARILARSSDELRRLVQDFNSMAGELQRQRRELERTHRLEAWAEMARQVAHDIKNPLTPIQLTAEHLRRVHADRGAPLSPVLQECVNTILTQVRLLRQIASEFSSFASSPTARPAATAPSSLLHEIVDPYRAGLQDRITFAVDVPESLPTILVDRALLTRALTNLIENALHAMPGRGTLTVTARYEAGQVIIRVGDTGAGMDAEALARAFEPYFSTKATGTGLGLTIAKRNVELNGGTIAVESERDRGTTVELRFPAAPA